MNAINSNNYLLSWIENLQAHGKNTFSFEQACAQFRNISDKAILQALSRLSSKNKVVSIFKGFYLIIPPEYSNKGIIPPMLFIDSLMNYTGKQYYVGLLSAAALYGAAHQQPQEFFVVNQLPAIRPTNKKGIKINYIGRKEIPDKFLVKRKTESGYVNVSSPELTAVDLLQYEKHIGGINRASTVINELSEEMNSDAFSDEFIRSVPRVMLQRLGYIVERNVGNIELANAIFKGLKDQYSVLERMPLKPGYPEKGFRTDSKWKIIENKEIEIDE
jgi:predicted transcriptional regulator of viral defense system